MEWNFKAPSWDMMSSSVVDEEATLPNIETTMEDDESSARFGVYYRTKGNDDDEFSVDLKLGHVGNYHFGSDHIVPNNNNNNNINNNNKSKVVGASSGVSKIASSSPYKRARASNNGTLRVSCLVDGCNSDLSTCRDYHRRHKVCEQHSKTPEVTIAGLKQRFCQQCSRFHSLEQFDEGKRSCRKRLDGHNRRRRKPQPEPLTRPGTFLSNYQGSQMLPLSSSSHSYSPSAMAMSPGWSSGGLVNSSSSDSSRLQHHHHHHQQDFFHGSSPAASSSYNKEENKHQVAAAASSSFLHSNSNATPIFNNNKMLFYDSNLVATSSVHDIGVVPPPRALSLLSPSSPSPSSSSQTHHHRSMCVMQQPLGLSLLRDDDNNSNSFESVDRVLAVPNNNNNNNNSNGSSSDHHCCPSPSLYYSYDNHNIGGSDGSHGNEAHHQLFPFQWE